MKHKLNSSRYAEAGVDTKVADDFIASIAPLAQKTWRPEVLSRLGGFSGLFAMPKGYREPVLVSSTDGVGTKLKLAFALQRHDDIGHDLVAMSVNDIIVQGAKPLFFLDYFACGQLQVETAQRVLASIARACETAGCALLGGETAEMPDMYPHGEYDLAGFAVGVVEKEAIIDGCTICVGDAILGLASNGPHANGYSLIRKIITPSDFSEKIQNQTVADLLMQPTMIYVATIQQLLTKIVVKGMAHITGGGLIGNIPRILPAEVQAVLDHKAWCQPEIFQWLQEKGNIPAAEMHQVFNCGLGMVLVISRNDVVLALQELQRMNISAWEIGTIEPRVHQTTITII